MPVALPHAGMVQGELHSPEEHEDCPGREAAAGGALWSPWSPPVSSSDSRAVRRGI